MILTAQTIRQLAIDVDGHRPMIKPFYERTVVNGMTFGLGPAGYDVRIAQHVVLPPHGFVRASVIEHIALPHNIMGWIADKSSWARKGVCVQNSKAEPGWRGHLTLEITNHSGEQIEIAQGSPMAHVVFVWLDHPTMEPYDGKYQDQPAMPVPAIHEVPASDGPVVGMDSSERPVRQREQD